MLPLLVALACSEPAVLPPVTVAPTTTTSAERTGYDDALADLDFEIEATRVRVEARPDDWIASEQLAQLFLARARLSGSYDDHAAAEAALETAYTYAAPGSGPHETRATLHYTLHRFPEVPDAIAAARDRILLPDDKAARLTLLEANLAWQTGAYEQALAGYEDALALQETGSARASLAYAAWRTLDFDAAEVEYARADDLWHGTTGEPHAWLHLQLGLMDLERGRLEDALAHYDDADAALSGWWLVEEHRAEALARLGREEEALAIYRRVLEQTGDAPEFLDAVAGIHAANGRTVLAERHARRAAAGWEERLARYPEATYGHALAHYLEFGPPLRAVAMAEANLALRPGAEAHLGLALALLAADRPTDALVPVETALATPWRTAELHDTAARVYEALGRTEEAKVHRREAARIDPTLAP